MDLPKLPKLLDVRGLDQARADLGARLWEWVSSAQDLLAALRAQDMAIVGTGTRPPNARTLKAGANITLTDAGPGSTLTIASTASGDASGLRVMRPVQTADTTISDKEIVFVDCTGGDVDLTAPDPAGTDGREFMVIRLDESGNLVRVLRHGSEQIQTNVLPYSTAVSYTFESNFTGVGHWIYESTSNTWRLFSNILPTIAADLLYNGTDSVKTALDSLFVTVSALSGSAGLWAHPASPHADDEEFETTSMPSGWILRDISAALTITPSGTPDPYSNPTTHTAKFAAHTNWRTSHLALQPCGESNNLVFAKPITPSTNMFIWCRTGRGGTAGTGAGERFSFGLFGDSGGLPDFNNCVLVGYHGGAAGGDIVSFKVVSGTETFNGGITAIRGTPPWEYFSVQKVGTDYWCHAFSDNGARNSWAKLTHSGTMAWIGYRMASDATAPGANLYLFDFVRRVDSAQGMPT